MDIFNITNSVRIELLNLGMLVMLLAPQANETMTVLVDKIVEDPKNNSQAIQNIMTRYPGNETSLLDSLGILQAYIRSEGHPTYSLVSRVIGNMLPAIGGMFVALRFFARRHSGAGWRGQDWTILTGWIGTVVYLTLCLLDRELGKTAHHVWDVSRDNFKAQLRILMGQSICYSVTTFFIKFSALILYWELVPRGTTQFRYFHWSIIGVFVVIVIFTIIGVAASIFECRPITYWNDILNAKCLSREAFWWISGGTIEISNTVVLLLPIRVVWQLQLRRREKIIVSILFGLGGLSCFAFVPRILATTRAFKDPDTPWKLSSSTAWAELEFQAAIIALCLPSTKSLVLKTWPRLVGYTKERKAKKSNNSSDTPPPEPQVELRSVQVRPNSQSPRSFYWAD